MLKYKQYFLILCKSSTSNSFNNERVASQEDTASPKLILKLYKIQDAGSSDATPSASPNKYSMVQSIYYDADKPIKSMSFRMEN